MATTLPFSELVAESHLIRQKFQAFIPKVSTDYVRRGVQTIRIRPYLPGYVFVRFDREEPGNRWRSINGTRGVRRLWTCGDVPIRIRDDAMQVLIDQCVDGFVKEESVDMSLKKLIPVGTHVTVTEGPFASFSGRVAWSHDDRVKVLVGIFGRETEVEMDARCVAT